jgi:hypothetical protein
MLQVKVYDAETMQSETIELAAQLPKTGRGAADVEWVAFFPVTREIQRQRRRDNDPRRVGTAEASAGPGRHWCAFVATTFRNLKRVRQRDLRLERVDPVGGFLKA